MIHVLLVDDEPLLLDLGKIFLEQSGDFMVDTAASATEAMDLLKLTQYDAVVSDYEMPEIDGITFLKKIRSENSDIPFIIFTGRGREEVVIEAIESGANFYLQKGGEPGSQYIELAHKIRQSVDQRRTEDIKNTLINNHMQGVLIINNAGELIFANDRFIRTFDTKSLDKIVGMNVFSYIDPEFHISLRNKLNSLINKSDCFTARFRAKNLKGKAFWFETFVSQIIYQDDKMKLVFLRDITKHEQTQNILQEYEKFFRNFLDQVVNISVKGYGPDGTVHYWNRASEKMFGYNADYAIGKKIADLIIPGEGHKDFCKMISMSAKSQAIPTSSRNLLIRNDGSPIPVFSSNFAAELPDSKTELFSIDVDLTEWEKTKDAFRETEQWLNLAVEAGGLGLWDWNIITDERAYNQSWADMIGYTLEELENKTITWEELSSPDMVQFLKKIRQDHIDGKTPYFEAEYPIKCRDGHWIWVRNRGQVTKRDCCGRPVRLSGIHLNITEKLHYREALETANSKLNLLSSITRHDILNQITGLEGYIQLLQKSLKDNPEAQNYLDKIRGVSRTINRHILFTKDYQNLGTGKPIWQNMEDIGRRISSSALTCDIHLAIKCYGVEIFADPLFEKVLFNLFENAVRHGKEVTEICISFCEDNEGSGVLIVEDNGAGIPAEMKERIFEKGFGYNSGLGLFISKEILSITGINIVETGREGAGARFKITVPESGWRKGEQ